MVLLHHLAELRRDARRQVRRDPAAEADDLDVRDLAQPLEDVLQPAVGEHHRVAARQDDVADLGMLARCTANADSYWLSGIFSGSPTLRRRVQKRQ